MLKRQPIYTILLGAGIGQSLFCLTNLPAIKTIKYQCWNANQYYLERALDRACFP